MIALLTELSADGQVTREEMERLREWLKVDRGLDFPACAFLYEVVETVSGDGVITEEELYSPALAIERVLPPDVRVVATQRRKEHRAARRAAVATKRRAERAQERGARREARQRAKPPHRADFMVMGRRLKQRSKSCWSQPRGTPYRSSFRGTSAARVPSCRPLWRSAGRMTPVHRSRGRASPPR